jgi:hypothetical protein
MGDLDSLCICGHVAAVHDFALGCLVDEYEATLGGYIPRPCICDGFVSEKKGLTK